MNQSYHKQLNLEVSQKDLHFIRVALDLLGQKLQPKNRLRGYTEKELKQANELQTLINRVVWLMMSEK